MARFHRKMRARIDELAAIGQPVDAVVVLSTVTGLGPSPGSSRAPVSYNAAEDYVARTGLDPDLWQERQIGGFGLVCALTPEAVHFVRSTGSMRRGELEHASAWRREATSLTHTTGASVPGAATRVLHFQQADGPFVVGSAPVGRIATNEMNDVDQFIEAWGPTARFVEN